MDSADRPRLRALDAFPVEQDGERLIGLRDPSGFTEQVALLPVPALDIVSLFDGEHSVAEIHRVVSARHGERAPGIEDIAGFAARLDDAGFLDSPRFAERRRRIEETWLASPSRPAAHAGGAYAGEADALRSQIDGFFVHPEGPGLPEARAVPERLRGLIAPHIDFHRGGPTYAWAYRALVERSDADLFVILGTCHGGMADPFAATLKPYDTPLGAAEVDRGFFEALQRRYRHDLLASEAAHRSEHSVEFQAVMLRRLLGARAQVTVVSEDDRFVFLPSLPWLIMGWRKPDDITLSVSGILRPKGIEFLHEAARQVDPENHRVETITRQLS